MNPPPPQFPDLSEILSRALDWQTLPPIAVHEPGNPAHGAVRHGMDARDSTPMGIYTETTGYAISLFAFLHSGAVDRRFLDAATRAADYLLSIQWPEGSYPHLPDPAAGSTAAPSYAFDTAMCIVGLVRLHRISGDPRHLESATAAGRWLLSMIRADGSFKAMWRRGREAGDPGSFWGDGSCIHAKNAMALMELHAATGLEEMRGAARRVCDHILTLQEADGAFWSMPSRLFVFTHAHAYACEGLLHAGTLLGDERYLVAARRGVDWMAARQRSDGGWDSRHKSQGGAVHLRMLAAMKKSAPSDAAAQGARLLRLLRPGDEDRWLSALRFVASCQCLQGGLLYERTRFGYSSFVCTWCTQFAIQALAWRDRPAAVADLF